MFIVLLFSSFLTLLDVIIPDVVEKLPSQTLTWTADLSNVFVVQNKQAQKFSIWSCLNLAQSVIERLRSLSFLVECVSVVFGMQVLLEILVSTLLMFNTTVVISESCISKYFCFRSLSAEH